MAEPEKFNLPNLTADFANEVARTMAGLADAAATGELTEADFTMRVVAFLRTLDEWVGSRIN